MKNPQSAVCNKKPKLCNFAILQSCNRKGGFTLIELLVVLGLTVAIGTTTLLYLGRYRGVKDLERSSDELLAVIQATQKRSITQESGKTWGIRFINPASGSDYYEVFKGLSYAAGTVDRTYYFRRGASFLNPTASFAIDMIFRAIRGTPSQSQVISIGASGSSGYLSDIFINASSGLSGYRIEQGVQGYWHLDENTATTTYDASGYGNTGTLTNGPTWQTGSSCKAGGCLGFNGSSTYVSISNELIQGTVSGFSLVAWVKFNSVNGGDWILGRRVAWNDRYIALLNDSTTGFTNQVLFLVFRTNSSCSGNAGELKLKTNMTLNTGTWYHIVGTVDGSNVYIYVNGEQQASGSLTNITNFVCSSDAWEIGGDGAGGGWGGYLDGAVDEARIYNRALSASEIQAMYNDLK